MKYIIWAVAGTVGFATWNNIFIGVLEKRINPDLRFSIADMLILIVAMFGWITIMSFVVYNVIKGYDSNFLKWFVGAWGYLSSMAIVYANKAALRLLFGDTGTSLISAALSFWFIMMVLLISNNAISL